MIASRWDRRIERAEELARAHPASAEILRFYGEVARLQKSVYNELESGGNHHPDVSVLLPHFSALLSVVKREAPAPLARIGAELAQDRLHWQDLLAEQDSAPERAFFSRTLLQPYFEYRAGRSGIATSEVQPTCPFCGERPLVAVLRGEGEGARRSLVCSLCATEWSFRRLLCPNCGEETERNLPVYIADEFPYVRIEACDTCRIYIKSVDFTRNGLAVPVVDELATVALNLWAEEHEYTKLQLNLLGM
jgi:FdhE protein